MVKKLAVILAVLFAIAILAPAIAGPLFPDVPAEHWARDAVANLAAKGLLEGYPDGTFKGDRAATRWEMAMLVARFLAKMEQEHATFASKADLEELQNLVNSLKDELAALGVRVGKLEDKVGDLDKRVVDLERIRFSGDIDSIFVTNNFHFSNASYSGNLTYGGGSYQYTPTFWQNSLLDGRSYFLGSSETLKGTFDVKAKLSDTFDAGLNLYAYVSMGDENVSSLNGVSAPYLNNFFTQRLNVDYSGAHNNTPWTRVNMDSFWLKHNPTGNKLTVGSFDANICPLLYSGQLNPNTNGPKYLNNYGFQFTGTAEKFLGKGMDYEVFYTKLADGNVAGSYGYDSFGTGLDLKWNFDKGSFKLNYMRAVNDYTNSVNTNYFNIVDQYTRNDVLGQDMLGTWSAFMQWVNPADYAAQAFSLADSQNNLAPVAGDNSNPMGIWLFSLGPQSQANYGARFDYEFNGWKADAEFASTTYKPNRNSGYNKNGTAFDIAVGTTLVNGTLDLGLDYVSTSPYYDPMIMQYAPMTDPSSVQSVNDQSVWEYGFNSYFLRLPEFSYFANLYQMHDSKKYPNNRDGIRFNGTWKFAGDNGKFNLDLGFLQQQKNSVYTQNYTYGGNDVNGFDPGWIEPIFTPLARDPNGGYGANFLASENNKGKQNNYGIGICYTFPNSKLSADLGWLNYNFKRDSSYSAGATAADNWGVQYQNYVNLNYNNGKLGFRYPLNDKWNLRLGYEYGTLKGHHAGLSMFYGIGYDPSVSGLQAPASLDPKCDNINFTQSNPYVGFDYQITQNATWGLNIKFLNLSDKTDNNIINQSLYTGAPNQGWSGTQLFTEVKIKY